MEHRLSIGLALSGGGYKGLAHAGVLQFFDEQGLDIEIISGTSAGSIVGCMYAFGKKPTEILHFFQSVKLFSWNHIGFQRAGLFDAEKFIVYLDEVFGDARLVDLNKEVYVLATDINSGKLKIFNRQTKVKEAIAASSAFPGVFSPVNIDGRLYSDGGILLNFPVSVIQGRCDVLVGVNLDPSVTIDRRKETFKTIKSVAFRAINIMMTQNSGAQNELCDWCISPLPLIDYNIFETSKERMAEIYQLGYDTAKKEFEQFKHTLPLFQ